MTRPGIVKLGGSILTDKGSLKTPREGALPRLADELASLSGPLVLVHGAGSYGHVRSDRYGLDQGEAAATPEQAARVHADIEELHRALLDALVEAGLAPASIPPFPLARARKGDLDQLESAPVEGALDRGFLPVTRGDVVPDEDQGFAPVSGDALLVRLAEALDCRLAVFATDVPGILDDDGEVVHRVGPDEARSLGSEADPPDVTGGMAAKAAHAAALAEAGVPVRIVDGTTPGRIRGALEGDPVTGTLVTQGGST